MDLTNEILGLMPIKLDEFDSDYTKDKDFNDSSLPKLGVIKDQPSQDCTNDKNHKVWLVSYAGGKEIHFKNQKYQLYSAINKCIDFALTFNFSNLEKSFIEENHEILSMPRGGGYWLWKPYIILKTLESIPKDDVLIYVDSGAAIKKQIDTLINNLADKDIILFENSHSNTKYTKRDLLKIFDMDNEKTRKSYQLSAGFLAIRNNNSSYNFIQEWLNYCKITNAITDSRSIDEYPDFFDHRHDQSILSLLWLKYQESNLNITNSVNFNHLTQEEWFNHHRRRG